MPRAAVFSIGGLLAAVAALNLALTFENAWPTPWPRAAAAISVELAVLLGLLALAAAGGVRGGVRGGVVSRTARLAASIVVVALIGVRYGVVTSAGLFGRPIDLYWDLRHVPGVAASLIDSWPAWQWLAVVVALAALLVGLGGAASLAVGTVARALAQPTVRRVVLTLSLGVVVVFAIAPGPPFAGPVTPAVARQASLFVANVTRADARVAAVDLETKGTLATLGTPAGGDVFVIFVESYGVTVFDDPSRRAALAAAYASLDADRAAAGWLAASATVTSPTFGSASWLAHASLLSGQRVATQSAYAAWLGGAPATLAHRFRAAGRRAVALMPGIKQPWPAGAAMGFDAIYDAAALNYPGPSFGWWAIPDQYALAWLHEREVARQSRPPLFVFTPMIMSHAPFAPVPPYLPDWAAVTSTAAYAGVDPAGRSDLATDYLRAIDHELRLIGGFLAERAPPDALVLVLGDHQPPAVVTGPGARWDVPVHVFAHSAAALDRFLAAGFVPGLTPPPRPIGGTASLTQLLLAAPRR